MIPSPIKELREWIAQSGAGEFLYYAALLALLPLGTEKLVNGVFAERLLGSIFGSPLTYWKAAGVDLILGVLHLLHQRGFVLNVRNH